MKVYIFTNEYADAMLSDTDHEQLSSDGLLVILLVTIFVHAYLLGLKI